MSTLEPPRGLLADSYSPTFGIAYRGQLFAQRKEQVEKYVPDDADYAVGFAGAMGKATAGPACPMELVISVLEPVKGLHYWGKPSVLGCIWPDRSS